MATRRHDRDIAGRGPERGFGNDRYGATITAARRPTLNFRRSVMMKMVRFLVVTVAFLAAGCLESETLQCASGLVCPAKSFCSDDGTACIAPQSCGNGVVEGSEAYDPGDEALADTCSSDCLTPLVCGDGILAQNVTALSGSLYHEDCDDGPRGAFLDRDGCSSTCVTETPQWTTTTSTGSFPARRYFFSLAYQPQRGSSLLFSGRSNVAPFLTIHGNGTAMRGQSSRQRSLLRRDKGTCLPGTEHRSCSSADVMRTT
jgi:cysteine-rich repeat protein